MPSSDDNPVTPSDGTPSDSPVETPAVETPAAPAAEDRVPEEKAARTMPAWTRGSVRQILIPVLGLVLLIAPSLRVLESGNLPDLNYPLCQMGIVKSDAPPSDVLFMGSSRTGAGIDAPLIQSQIAGSYDSAEKVVLTLGSELDRDLTYRSYVEHRGVPKVLAIELSFERESERVEEAGSMFRPTARTTSLFEAHLYQDLISSLRGRGEVPVADMFVKSRFTSTPKYFFDRLGVGADKALRSPNLALVRSTECKFKLVPRRGRWVVGNTEPFVEANAELPGKKKRKQWTERSLAGRPLDLNDPFTADEFLLLEDLVLQAKKDGVEDVILYYFPSYGEKPGQIDLDELASLLPDVHIFDARPVLDDPDRPSLKYQYFDANHMNKYGAYELSSALAQMVEELSR